MLSLDILTILCTGFLTGNELAVSLFIDPAIATLEDRPRAQITSHFARTLGRWMPWWYALSLLLLLAEAALRRHESGFSMLLTAAGIWVATILYTVFMLVPINNRIARLELGAQADLWQRDHKKWDLLHRFRVAAIIVAMVCLTSGILSSH